MIARRAMNHVRTSIGSRIISQYKTEDESVQDAGVRCTFSTGNGVEYAPETLERYTPVIFCNSIS